MMMMRMYGGAEGDRERMRAGEMRAVKGGRAAMMGAGKEGKCKGGRRTVGRQGCVQGGRMGEGRQGCVQRGRMGEGREDG